MSGALAAGTSVIVSVFRPGCEICGTAGGHLAAPSQPAEITQWVMAQFDELVKGMSAMLAPQFPIVVTIHIVGPHALGFDVSMLEIKRVTRRNAAVAQLRAALPAFIEHTADKAIAGAHAAAVH